MVGSGAWCWFLNLENKELGTSQSRSFPGEKTLLFCQDLVRNLMPLQTCLVVEEWFDKLPMLASMEAFFH